MIPHLNSLLEMNSRGEMPIDEIVSHVIKVVALEGQGADYADLPEALREQVAKKLAWYRQSGGWFVVSNNGTENYGAYADKFLEKVGNL